MATWLPPGTPVAGTVVPWVRGEGYARSVPKTDAVRLHACHLVAMATAGVEMWVKRVRGRVRGRSAVQYVIL